METLLRKINRPVEFSGTQMSIEELLKVVTEGQELSLRLPAIQQELIAKVYEPSSSVIVPKAELTNNSTYLFKVRQYMTKPSTLDFDFHAKWNKDVPMPFRVMQGKVLKQTPGMVQMECHAVPLKTDNCIRCGRRLTHPVSRLYGVGPECGGHAHINPFQSEEELYASLDSLKEALSNVKWTGWVIRSAIEDYEEVKQ